MNFTYVCRISHQSLHLPGGELGSAANESNLPSLITHLRSGPNPGYPTATTILHAAEDDAPLPWRRRTSHPCPRRRWGRVPAFHSKKCLPWQARHFHHHCRGGGPHHGQCGCCYMNVCVTQRVNMDRLNRFHDQSVKLMNTAH